MVISDLHRPCVKLISVIDLRIPLQSYINIIHSRIRLNFASTDQTAAGFIHTIMVGKRDKIISFGLQCVFIRARHRTDDCFHSLPHFSAGLLLTVGHTEAHRKTSTNRPIRPVEPFQSQRQQSCSIKSHYCTFPVEDHIILNQWNLRIKYKPWIYLVPCRSVCTYV